MNSDVQLSLVLSGYTKSPISQSEASCDTAPNYRYISVLREQNRGYLVMVFILCL